MIKKLKIKFIILAASIFFILLAVIMSMINIFNYMGLVSDADTVLEFLSQNKGTFPDFEDIENGTVPTHTPEDEKQSFLDNMSAELPYESRFFSILLDDDEKIIFSDVSKIASVDDEKARRYATEAIEMEKSRGFIDSFRFLITEEGSTTRIIFLNCETKFDFFRDFLFRSLVVSFIAFLVVFFVLIIASERIIHPIIESYEKQKRFIADAGHELKTPLTIINANVDVLEMDFGENESLRDIQSQSARLANLTDKLVFLSKLEEQRAEIEKVNFNFSTTVEELTASFKKLAKANGKHITTKIQKDLTIYADQIQAGQIVSILLENAVKYSPSGAEIYIELVRQNKWISLSVENPSVYPLEEKKVERVFERFYRMDESRSSSVGGYGMGLSIAKAIAESNSGRITTEIKSGNLFKITVLFSHS